MPNHKKKKQASAKENEDCTLRSILSHVDDLKSFASFDITLSRDRCIFLIAWIQEGYDCHLFKHPVDWQNLQLYDYPTKIQEPMDLSTLLTYTKADEFIFSEWLRKSRLIWTNAMSYNPASNMVHLIAKRLYSLFEEKIIHEQHHVEDDDPERLRDVYLVLLMSIASEEFNNDFYYDISMKNYTDYATYIGMPMSFDVIIGSLKHCEYNNRFQIEDDVHRLYDNITLYPMFDRQIKIMASHMQNMSIRLLKDRHEDVDIMGILPNYLRESLIDQIASLTNDERLSVSKYIQKLCPDAICDECGVTSITVDYFNIRQFYKVRYQLDSCNKSV